MSKIAAVMGLFLCWELVAAAPGWSIEVGQAVPDFAAQTMDGNQVSRAGMAGKPVLLVFWNTWCPICMKELPEISKLADKFSANELTVVAVNTGLNDSENKAKAYWKKRGYRFPSVFDHHFDLGDSFKLKGVPMVLLVDATGTVRYKSTLLPDDLEQRVWQLSRR
jgi:peroxiredoxin